MVTGLVVVGPNQTAPAAAAEAPIRAAFYYGWFPETEHWRSQYTPTVGKYDSSDPAVVSTQVRQAKAAGLNAFISSWWGQATATDKRLPLLLDTAAAQGFKVMPYYEKEGFGNPSAAQLESDLGYLAAKAAVSPSWQRVGGKPVLFVYNADDTTCDVTARWAAANQGRFYLNMKVMHGYRTCAVQPDSWHQYGPASTIQNVLPWSSNVAPGFWRFDEAAPRLVRDLATFKAALAEQVKSGAQWQLMTSWNEWGEGTGVESTVQFSQAYTDAMASAYNPPVVIPDATGATLTSAADTYVKSNTTGANYGLATTLQQNATSTATAVSYLRFAAPTATVTKATLRLFSRSSGITRSKVFSTSATWDERTMTWANRPALGAQVGTTGTLTAGQWTVADVTSAVRGGVRSFGVTTGATATRYFDSREAANPPQLVLEYGTAPTSPAPTSTAPTSPTPTSTAPTTSPVIAAVGDIACAPGYTVGSGCQHKAVADKIISDTAVSKVLALGDLQYESGALSAFLEVYDKSWGPLKSKTKPVPGNHEYQTSGAAGYYDYFGALAGDRTKGYYSFDVGAWHFVALNSERDITAGGAQVAWLKADLAAHPNKCVGALFHKPRWSSGTHGDHSSMAPFVQALYNAGAEVILSGHDHDYERFYPLNPSGVRDDARGIVQIVSGQGGKNHYAVTGRSTTAAKDNTSHGYARLTLHPDSADVTFVSAVGSYRDTAKITCR
ncbi:MAG TPA: DNRLRE domain-containing protein [Jatrophihabitans sp.]|uniref:CBM96 family carbohydrate-binding protein n=1 Tax=Jatrophihabitans sp. TaxID=1932789 RepID=UPI002EE9A686